ncbi:4-hydroxy-tetrahydrodipicolinate reductase [Ornithinimicrobium sufpigmenti]|uniref:4-hydroxy-tetrahydrodipicolinate reductase n=1 Tax=Ornithinimicrobium sufpigmenti TaxID=2508882 RepID=UPI001035F74C|nr:MULTISPECIES: dihydrodipicolinate reductase C-terminal domain-containing protein [unclassified Ornithinimicrobium]
MLTLGLLGTGRLGTAIRALADATDDLEVRWGFGREGLTADAPRVDVAIDVSTATAVPAHLRWARATGTDLVIGTTGWDPAVLCPGAGDLRVLTAPNFSLGVALLSRLAQALGGYATHSPTPVDLAVTDTHHRHKVDAPSGTAIALRQELARGAGRAPEDVQVTSLRLGEVVGDHEVIASSALETLTLRHTAHSRDLFAAGALTAARWLADRPEPGLYTLDDLAADHLRGLLAGPTPTSSPAGAPAGDPTPAGAPA